MILLIDEVYISIRRSGNSADAIEFRFLEWAICKSLLSAINNELKLWKGYWV
jgi:hypothetical protein